MTVQCAHCGEPLLGSVNRCWRCGRTLVAHAGPADVPPVRRPPITGPLDAQLDAPVAAILMDEPTLPESRPIRRGSPFATPQVSDDETVKRNRFQFIGQIGTTRRQSPAYMLSGSFSILMGLIALAVAYPFSPGSFGIALAGIGFGIWGLKSQTRVTATVGLIVCGIAFIVSCYFLAA